MAKIIVNADCGNAPKRELLKKINIAFVEGDTSFILDHVTDTIIWDMVGARKIEGKEQLASELDTMKSEAVKELLLCQILTHGKEGAARGTVQMQSGKKYSFADLYEFSGAKGNKIKSITSYIIEI